MSPDESVSQWLARRQEGNPAAAQHRATPLADLGAGSELHARATDGDLQRAAQPPCVDVPTGDEQATRDGAGQARLDAAELLPFEVRGLLDAPGCQPQPRELMSQIRVRLAEDILSSFQSFYATTFTQCDAGCGVIVRVIEGF